MHPVPEDVPVLGGHIIYRYIPGPGNITIFEIKVSGLIDLDGLLGTITGVNIALPHHLAIPHQNMVTGGAVNNVAPSSLDLQTEEVKIPAPVEVKGGQYGRTRAIGSLNNNGKMIGAQADFPEWGHRAFRVDPGY
jgi:hypothetical protein